jgi:ribonucleoside-diphosphate reductase alpha chain
MPLLKPDNSNRNNQDIDYTNMTESMYVIKRTGEREEVSFDKCLKRIQKLSKDLKINPMEVSQLIITQIYDGVETNKLDELAAEICAAKTTIHPDYGKLASRIIVSNHHKNTSPSYSEVIQVLWNNKDVHGVPNPLINEALYKMVMDNKEKINATLDYERDFNYDYFGFKTLERAYLLRIGSKIIERPQHMLMRVALGIHKDDLKEALKAYKMMSDGYFTHATPTLFNMGTQREQASSCFLMTIDDDSVDGIFKTMSDCAKISKHAGGIGIAIHKIRAKGTQIRGTNGTSNGIVPMLKCFNEVARYIDQCFTPDTLVYTMEGVKRIEDIGIGDKVLGSDGNFHNVNLPVRHQYNGKMLKIQIKNAIDEISITPEHQVFALREQKKGLNFTIIKNRLDKQITKPEFCDAKDLTLDDFLVYSIPTYENDMPQFTEDDCRMYGILLGDGHISSAASGVSLSTLKKQNVIDFVKIYLTERGIKINEYKNDANCIQIKWSSASPGFKFTRAQLYDSDNNKKVDSKFIHLPINKIKKIIKGILETDGCIGEKEITLEISSNSIIESVRYMLLRMGGLSSGYNRNRIGNVSSYKNITTKKETQVLRIPRIPEIMELFPDAPKGEYFTYLKHGSFIYSRIESISEFDYNGVVHDFEISETHDYTVSHMGIAHNGGGKRSGSFSCYLEPWHADIEDFLKLRLNTGIEEERARDLFYALWVPDLFMRRVEEDGDWTLMCPDKCPSLYLKYGREFDELYTKYEQEGRGNKVVKARKIWEMYLQAQIETGMPYLGFKDSINEKNNQKNLGTIQCSNLCHEICEYTSKEEIAVCNLASIALPKFVEKDSSAEGKLIYNYEKLREVVKQVVKNLNKVIDYNYYPVKEAEYSNRKNRPIGIGCQGLSDTFAMMKMAFDSPEARALNRKIFENMYYAALESSMELARKRKKYVQEYKRLIKLGSTNSGEVTEEDKKRLEEIKRTHWIIDEELKLPNQYAGAYSSFVGSPLSEGKLQFDLWGAKPSPEMEAEWSQLRADILKHGARNSLLCATMPTASTSQVLGYNECFEPFTNNIYTRKTLAGTFVIVNKYLINDLLDLGLWTPAMKDRIILADGSVQGIKEIPQEIRDRYKTVWEMSQRVIIDMAANRGPFICQTQSMNTFVKNPTFKVLNSMHFHGWKVGLKTGCYYLRSQAKTSAQKFSVDMEHVKKENKKDSNVENKDAAPAVTPATTTEKAEPAECLMCSA